MFLFLFLGSPARRRLSAALRGGERSEFRHGERCGRALHRPPGSGEGAEHNTDGCGGVIDADGQHE